MKKDHVHTHTKTMPNGTKLDILRLIERTKDYPQTLVHLDKLKDVPGKNKRTGFKVKRYEDADISYPLIASSGSRMSLLDGRHRFWKHRELGHNQAPIRFATAKDIKHVTMKMDKQAQLQARSYNEEYQHKWIQGQAS